MNLFFWDGWGPTPPPPGTQIPAASRYRGGYRAHFVTGAGVLLAVLLWAH